MANIDHQYNPLPGLDRVAFCERGYTVVRQLFAVDEIERLRDSVIKTFAEMERQGRVGTDPGREGTIRGLDSDLLSIPSLRHLLLDPRLLRVIGELLGGEPVYFGDSSIRIGKNGVRAWHRDNVNRARRRGPDWRDHYPLLRCGLYLQDHSRHSGGLAVRPHSHEGGRLLPTLPKLVESGAGELVAWNMRTVHAGEVVRLRGLPGLPLNPRAQSRLPDRMRAPEDGERIVLFMAFGLPSSHLDNYVGYLRTRHYMQRSWSHSRFGPEVWEEAERAGLHVLRPIPTYGTPPDLSHPAPRPHVKRGETQRTGHRLADVLAVIREHPAITELAHTGYSLINFAEPRLRLEIEQLLRGWELARAATDARDLIGDPTAAPALLMGLRAGLGLDPEIASYANLPVIPGSRFKREATRQLMRGIAAISRPERVRVAVIATGKLALALTSLPAKDLQAAGVGVLPFPGLDHGGGALLALRRRLPLLTAYGPRRPGPGVTVHLPEQLDFGFEPDLDRALTILVERQLAAAAPEQDRAVRALGGLTRTHSLRALLLPGNAHGASRLLIEYAHDRNLRVGAIEHGDGLVDVAFAWGEGTFDVARFTEALHALAAEP